MVTITAEQSCGIVKQWVVVLAEQGADRWVLSEGHCMAHAICSWCGRPAVGMLALPPQLLLVLQALQGGSGAGSAAALTTGA
jgi:hypothetical protein